MKKISCMLICLLAGAMAFSQQPLPDGIYLVQQAAAKTPAGLPANRAAIQFNPQFVEEDPANYEPLVVTTDDFFALSHAGKPVIEQHPNQLNRILLQLTGTAAEKLKAFTEKHLNKKIVVVIDNEALTIYKIDKPVSGGLVVIARCSNGQACRQIARKLSDTIKA